MSEINNNIINLQGAQGSTGTIGTQGERGKVGLQGLQGAQGSVGLQGTRGCDGIQGARGSAGMMGAQGEVGRPGAQGNRGIQGQTGPQGPQGPQGLTGSRGFMGYVGKPGEVGIQGLQGAKGHIWIDGVSLDGYNTHLFTLSNNKLQSVDGSLLTLGNGAKISLWLDENCYNYLVNNECRITVDDNVYATDDNGEEVLLVEEKTIPVYYAGSALLNSIISIETDLNTIVELVYYNGSWYYAGGLIGLNSSESVSYTAGDGINIDSNNVINVKIAVDNALQVNENGELFVSQSENPESVKYEAGNSIEISDDNRINVIVSESENNILDFDENGKLFVPQIEIPEIPESVEYTAGQGVEISESNEINVKISTSEDNALGLNEFGELFVPQVEIPEIPEQIEYTAGQGIDINENNEISVKLNDIVSESENNILTIDENGKLSVPQVEIPEQYNVRSSDSEEDFVKVNVTKNDESKEFELKTSIKTVSLFDLPDDENGLVTAQDVKDYIKWYVLQQFKEELPKATVQYDKIDDDELLIDKDGLIGVDDIKAIEEYIDNSDMGKY